MKNDEPKTVKLQSVYLNCCLALHQSSDTGSYMFSSLLMQDLCCWLLHLVACLHLCRECRASAPSGGHRVYFCVSLSLLQQDLCEQVEQQLQLVVTD